MTFLNILIVGGGIGGLSAATFLAQDGHKVTVLERQSESYHNQRTGGISFFNNSRCLWKQRGILDRILTVADSGTVIRTFSYQGQQISALESPMLHSYVHRADLSKVLHELAIEHKVIQRFSINIESIDDTPGNPSVSLAGGEKLEADLVIAADGINSFVRGQLFPDIEIQLTSSVVALVNIPAEAMLKNEGTSALWQDKPFHHFLGPKRHIVSWPMTKHNPSGYHLQFSDHAYGKEQWYGPDSPEGPLVTTITELDSMRQRWADFEPRIQHILKSMQSYTRWKIAAVPDLPSWSSQNNGFVLLGDSAHAVPPFAGQGANMSVEDAMCLATLLRHVKSKADLPKALELYNSIRMPRLASLRQIIQMNIENFGAGGDTQRQRNAHVPDEGKEKPNVKNNSETDWRKHGTSAAWKWLLDYDTAQETEKAWLQACEQQSSKL